MYFMTTIVFLDLYPDFVTFSSKDLGPNSAVLDNDNLDVEYFGYCHPKAVNHVRLMGWKYKYKQCKASKKR